MYTKRTSGNYIGYFGDRFSEKYKERVNNKGKSFAEERVGEILKKGHEIANLIKEVAKKECSSFESIDISEYNSKLGGTGIQIDLNFPESLHTGHYKYREVKKEITEITEIINLGNTKAAKISARVQKVNAITATGFRYKLDYDNMQSYEIDKLREYCSAELGVNIVSPSRNK